MWYLSNTADSGNYRIRILYGGTGAGNVVAMTPTASAILLLAGTCGVKIEIIYPSYRLLKCSTA